MEALKRYVRVPMPWLRAAPHLTAPQRTKLAAARRLSPSWHIRDPFDGRTTLCGLPIPTRGTRRSSGHVRRICRTCGIAAAREVK